MKRNVIALAALIGIFAGLAFVMGSASNAQAADLDGHVMMGEYDHATAYDNGRYLLYWSVDSGTAHIAIRAQTTGWVALGLSPTEAMNNSDILLGYVTDLGEVMLFDAYATGPYGPHPLDTDLGGSNDVTMYNGSEVGGWTTIEFQRLVNTGDMYDKPFINYITINWAVGPDDSFTTQHTRRGSATFPGIGELTLVSVPEMVYAGEQVDVTFNLSLWGAYTYDMVSHAAVHWDITSHPEPWAITNYPHASNIVSGDPMGDYMVQFTAPEQTGMVYFILHSIISGTHVYGIWEYTLEVKEMPNVAFVSAADAAFVGRDVTVEWFISNAEASEITHTAVHWDTVSHADDMMFGNYANAVLATAGAVAGEYYANITLPEGTDYVYYIIHSIINDQHFYNLTERSIEVLPLPLLTWVDGPEITFVNRTTVLEWMVDARPSDITHTAVHWDTMSHDGGTFDMYPYAVLGTQTSSEGDYMAELTAPAEPGTIYYVLHAIVLGENFYAPMEYTISVLEEPKLTLDTAPDSVIVGKDALFEWTVGGVIAEGVSHTALHWDSISHAGGVFSDYPNALPGTMGANEGEYMTTMTAPSSPGTVYFVVHAIILGEHFYADGEQMLTVLVMPTITLDEAPEKAFVGRDVMFKWTIHDADSGDVTHTAVHWDTESHSGGVFSDYPNALPGIAGTGAGEYIATMTTPSSPSTVYFVAHAIVMGEHIYAAMEYMAMVKAEPTPTLVAGPTKAYVNSTVTFRWNVTGADTADVTHTAVHWDTTSHASAMTYDMYPNALPGLPGGAMSAYLASMTAPASPTMVYYIFHATVLGEQFYYMSEMTLDVREMPSITGVEFKDKVTAGKDVKVSFMLENAPVGEVSHVAVHWDTTSHAGTMDFNAYPNAATATPTADGAYEISFKAPKDKGTVYFVVHAIVDGEHYYTAGEQSLKVEEEDSPGFGAVAAFAAVVVSVGLGMAFMRRRDDE